MVKTDYNNSMLKKTNVGREALILALSSREEEITLKEQYKKRGLKFCVTEVGCKSDSTFDSKITNAVIGAVLNENLFSKTPQNLHALLHATEEAKAGIRSNNNSSKHFSLKVAIVIQDGWIAVAMFGESSMHSLTSHERCGLGTMHI